MADKEIIKALENEIHLVEYVDGFSADNVSLELLKNTLDLITRQQAEIERLKIIYTVKFNEKEIEQIKDDILQDVEYNINNIKSEAVKEFAKRLKDYLRQQPKWNISRDNYKNVGFSYDEVFFGIDHIIKEIEES